MFKVLYHDQKLWSLIFHFDISVTEHLNSKFLTNTSFFSSCNWFISPTVINILFPAIEFKEYDQMKSKKNFNQRLITYRFEPFINL